MFLSLENIKDLIESKTLKINPFDESLLKPVSYTFRVGNVYIDEGGDSHSIEPEGLTLEPGQFVIIESLETIEFPENIGGLLSTRGSIAKKGLDGLLTDTVIEPGSTGKLTFCTKNQSTQPLILKTGALLVKCLFFKTG
jgi:dCTP deaminase